MTTLVEMRNARRLAESHIQSEIDRLTKELVDLGAKTVRFDISHIPVNQIGKPMQDTARVDLDVSI